MSRAGRILLLGLGLLLSAAASKPPAIELLRADAFVEYPLEITFQIEAESDVEIRLVELEYGLIGRDCTPDLNLAVPEDFSPGKRVDLGWTWRLAASGNMPPGTQIWWNWHLVDADGNEVRSEKQWITWIDSVHDWKALTSGNIILHWYGGSEAYNLDFLKTAETAREVLRNDVGVWPTRDINLYIYRSNAEMKEALVGEPDWIGGLSFGENQRTIIIGIDPGNEAWGNTTISHELAHTAVDSVMGGCYASIPLWLNEGIAMVAEGSLASEYANALEDAVYYDSLFSLRSISDEYQYIDGDPTLTYAEAYSVTQYIIGEYGNVKILHLLQRLGEGYTDDNALREAFGVDTDRLEKDWRAAIGADPMPERTPDESLPITLQTTLPPSYPAITLSTPTPSLELLATDAPGTDSSASVWKTSPGYPWSIAALCAISLACIAVLAVAGALVFWVRRKARSA
jgi:hypothetical protein